MSDQGDHHLTSQSTEFLLGIVGIGLKAMQNPNFQADVLCITVFENVVNELMRRGIGSDAWNCTDK